MRGVLITLMLVACQAPVAELDEAGVVDAHLTDLQDAGVPDVRVATRVFTGRLGKSWKDSLGETFAPADLTQWTVTAHVVGSEIVRAGSGSADGTFEIEIEIGMIEVDLTPPPEAAFPFNSRLAVVTALDSVDLSFHGRTLPDPAHAPGTAKPAATDTGGRSPRRSSRANRVGGWHGAATDRVRRTPRRHGRSGRAGGRDHRSRLACIHGHDLHRL